jgi:membrane fusion protein (multidrug efflux system)
MSAQASVTLPRDTQAEAKAAAPPRGRWKRPALLLAALAGLGAGAWYGYDWWTVGRFVMSTDDAYVGGDVTPIGAHVSGFVAKVLVTDNQYVHAGQPLIRLDPVDFQAALAHAEAVVAERNASLSTLEAQLVLQQSVIAEAAADIAARKATVAFNTEDAQRYQTLARSDAGSRQDAQRAVAAVQTAQAQLASANAALAAAQQQVSMLQSEIVTARARIMEAVADQRTAQLNLGYTEIDAPIAGYVGNRFAQQGAYVTAGTALLSVVPSTGLWVDANFKEDDLARMRPGDEATVVADVLPGRQFHGRVESLAPATGAVFSVIPPENATGNFTKIVQRVPVRIALEGNAATLGLLRLGLSTTVAVDIRGGATDKP